MSRGGGDPSALDANYPPPPQLTVGRKPLGVGGAWKGGFKEGRMGECSRGLGHEATDTWIAYAPG